MMQLTQIFKTFMLQISHTGGILTTNQQIWNDYRPISNCLPTSEMLQRCHVGVGDTAIFEVEKIPTPQPHHKWSQWKAKQREPDNF